MPRAGAERDPVSQRSCLACGIQRSTDHQGVCFIDLLIEDSLIVEIKSVDKLLPVHSAQLMTYMRLKTAPSGLLINFNVHSLFHGIRRILR
jgi:GxxExxY protein